MRATLEIDDDVMTRVERAAADRATTGDTLVPGLLRQAPANRPSR